MTEFEYEDLGDAKFDTDSEVLLASIAVSLKRIADELTKTTKSGHTPLVALIKNVAALGG
jgi:hypothetical protein